MLDIVIITVPGTITQAPPAAPALLKAATESAGFTCKVIDFNNRFYRTVNENLTEIENYFITGLNNQFQSVAESLIEEWSKEIANINPKYIGISVFTYQNRIATELFCKYLKKHSRAKIVIGGQGLADGGIMGAQGFAKNLLDKNLIDFYIKSEGERSLVELLKSNFDYPGINSDTFDQINDLDSLPIPDYSDYNLSEYKYPGLPITFSRGCVRSCSFCDIHEHWKYKFRSGKAVADEMIALHKQYSVTDFFFTDSLVNGNLKEFKVFCRELKNYNKLVGNKIKWVAQYIVRGKNQLDDSYWENLADSGAHKLAIGVETGSDTVRDHMKKGFTNSDLDYTMKMLDKYSITCRFLMIVGYPTETEKDFQDTLDMFERYKHLAGRIIIEVSTGSTLGILPGTPLYNKSADLHIELDKNENNWIALDNPTLSLSERIRRIKLLNQYLRDRDYYVPNDIDGIIQLIEQNIPLFEKRNTLKKLIRIKYEQTNQ